MKSEGINASGNITQSAQRTQFEVSVVAQQQTS